FPDCLETLEYRDVAGIIMRLILGRHVTPCSDGRYQLPILPRRSVKCPSAACEGGFPEFSSRRCTPGHERQRLWPFKALCVLPEDPRSSRRFAEAVGPEPRSSLLSRRCPWARGRAPSADPA